jgi:hypothetical protein
MTSEHQKQASRAITMIDTPVQLSCEPWLATELFICAALVADRQQVAPLALALELIDVRQHLLLSAEEAAAILRIFKKRGLLELRGEVLEFPDEVWKRLPRTRRGKLDTRSDALPQWQTIVES